jgi:hypothetical protein
MMVRGRSRTSATASLTHDETYQTYSKMAAIPRTGVCSMGYGGEPAGPGGHFLHPRLGFTFVAPEGFTLDNTAQAVLGVKEGGEALRLDVVRMPEHQYAYSQHEPAAITVRRQRQ